MTKLIGVAGRAHSGKDAFAAACVKHGYKRIAFADALKVATAHIANEESHLFFDDISKEEFSKALGMTRREALQKVGKAVRDSVGPETWVNRALNEWEASGYPATVISDVRYPNEAEAIRRHGGFVIRLVRPGAGLEGEAAGHESEAGIPDNLIDVEIHNDGTLGELSAEAAKIVAFVGGDAS